MSSLSLLRDGPTLKGLAFIFALALISFAIAQTELCKQLSFSPLIVGILLGTLYANTLRKFQPAAWSNGIKLCTKQILRFGIVLYGFRLTLADVYAVGLPAFMSDIIIVTGTLLLGIYLGKVLKLDYETTLMTATGSSICGAAAVLGAESVVKCQSHKTAIAVATVVIFGTIAMFLYPILYRLGLFESLGPVGTAIYTGSTLHEVAHVAAAGNAMDPDDSLGIAATATITKMIRVILLAPVLIIMAYFLTKYRAKLQAKIQANATLAKLQAEVNQDNAAAANATPNATNAAATVAATANSAAAAATTTSTSKTKIVIPYFAIFFLVVIVINTGIASIFEVSSVKDIPGNSLIELFDTFCLTMAMSALGTDNSLDKFKAAGAKPFVLAALLFVWLMVAGYILARFLPALLS